MSLPRYPEYKDSGVAWLGEIPAQWGVKRIKHTTYLKGRVGWKGLTSDEYLDDGYAYLVTGTDFSNKFINWRECHCVDEERYKDDPFIQLREGDLLITKDGTIGKVALVSGLDRPACLNSGIFLVRPTAGYITSYMYWVLQSGSFKKFCDLASLGSTIQHLYQNVFEDFAFSLPSAQEQTSIARFLDRETRKIDALIDEQEKLIALLAEKRQATISNAVTRGLNPDAPMKDSGGAWLGGVPAHWEIVRLGALFREVQDSGWDELPVLSVSIHDGVSDKELTEGEMDRKVARSDDRSKYKEVRPGDLTYNMMRAWQGGFGTVTVHGMVSPAYVVARPTKDFITSHVEMLLRTPQAVLEMKRYSRGITDFRLRLYWEEFKVIQIAMPPKREQLEISAFVCAESAKVDELTSEAERVIALLKERRSALIAAAVNGQIDVREVLEATSA